MRFIVLFAGFVLSAALFTNTWATERKEPARSGAGYATMGVTTFDLSEFNQRLEGQGYPTFPSQFIILGGGGYWQKNKMIFGGEGMAVVQPAKTHGTEKSRLSGGMGFVKLGYAFVQKNRLVVFPYLGLGGGGLTYSRYSTVSADFDDVLNGRSLMVETRYRTFLIRVALQGEYRFWKPRQGNRNGGMLVGFQLGYTFPVASGSWRFDETDVLNGPAIPFSGPFFTILFGGGGIHQ